MYVIEREILYFIIICKFVAPIYVCLSESPSVADAGFLLSVLLLNAGIEDENHPPHCHDSCTLLMFIVTSRLSPSGSFVGTESMNMSFDGGFGQRS